MLDRDTVIDEAVALASEGGLDQLSLRALASRLGVSAMALYRVVASKDELVDVVVERLVAAEASTADIDWPDDWPDALRAFAHFLRGTLHRHPSLLSAIQRSPQTRQVILEPEAVLSRMLASGMTPQAAASAFGAVLSYVCGFVAFELSRHAARLAANRSEADDRAFQLGRELMLPPGECPACIACAPYLIDHFDGPQFDQGLEAMIVGIQAGGVVRSD